MSDSERFDERRSTDRTGGPLVLIVDDHEDTCEALSLALSLYGFVTIAALKAAEAFALACERQPQAIVTDLAMPYVDGWELIQQLKAEPRTTAIPIVVVSGHVSDAIRARAAAEGCAGFIPKPCTPEVIADEIRALLSRETARNLVVDDAV